MNNMPKNIKKGFIFAFNVIIFFLISSLHYSNFLNFKILGAGATLIIPLLVAFSLWYSPLTCAIAGMLAGFVMDSSAHGTYCFNAIILLIIGTFVSVASSTFFNKNLPSAIVISLICSAFYHGIQWLVFHSFTEGAENGLTFFFEITLPTVILTALFIFPFYYLYKYVNKLRS